MHLINVCIQDMAMTDNTARFRAIVQILLENEQPDDNNIRDGRNFVAFRSTKELPPSPNYSIFQKNFCNLYGTKYELLI